MKPVRSAFFVIMLVASSLGGGSRVRSDRPEFHERWCDGHVSAPGESEPVGLALHWSETKNVNWKTEIPHKGWADPVVMGGQVWLATATEDGHDFFPICVDEK